jgi:serine protease Do
MRAMVGSWWVAVFLAAAPAGAGAEAKASKNGMWTEARRSGNPPGAPNFGKVARGAMRAVVAISVTEKVDAGTGGSGSEDAPKGIGAGFIIRDDGYILTSSHVVEGADQIDISVLNAQNEPESFPARIIGQDPQTDFALLKIDAPRKLPVLRLGSARSVDIADWVIVIGNPFGLAHSVTVGVVSFKGRNDVTPTGRTGYFDYLQTDASINPGNSGGPVLDLNGDVVAIANAVNVAGQGIGFAIPIDIAKEVVPQLARFGRVRRGWLGISVQDLTGNLAETFGPHGVVISDVVPGSPAEKSGLKVGDVITGMNESPMRRAQLLRWKVATAGVGSTVKLELHRGKKRRALSVLLQEAPESVLASEALQTSEEKEPAMLDFGAAVSEVDSQASERAGLAAPFGALIRSVRPGSVVERAGLHSGDVVLKINTAEVVSHDEFVRSMTEVPGGSVVRLFVRRAGRTLFLAFKK